MAAATGAAALDKGAVFAARDPRAPGLAQNGPPEVILVDGILYKAV